MLKQTILAVASVATLAVALIPVTTGSALAQRQPCTSVRCGGGDTPGGDSYDECTAALGHLRRVYEEELEPIANSGNVMIEPICVSEDGMFRNVGNVGTLRVALADNDAIMEALFRKNFGSEDVVGIRMIGDDKAIIYVLPWSRYY
jgi:hypothetical protein